MKILILGASGMLGHTLFVELLSSGWEVYGSVREVRKLEGWLPPESLERLVGGVDAFDFPSVRQAVNGLKPDVIINCVGLIRQKPEGQRPLPCIEINSRFPHLLLALARENGCRLIHYSTDCVFDGLKGSPYTEDDFCSAKDIYGLSKYLGEISGPGALTLRTSIIGHELFGRKNSLMEWFLSREGQVGGYTHALYTGLPVDEHARILAEYVLPRADLEGLYQLASAPVSKYELLNLAAVEYGKKIIVNPDDSVRDDKRLSGAKFNLATGYSAPGWAELIKNMHKHHLTYYRR